MEHQPAEAGDLIGSNDDLLTEILLRLPATSILRFKSVSEHWRWLLSHRQFTRMYDKHSKSPGFFCGQYMCSVWQYIFVPFDVENRSTPFPFRSLESYFDGGDVRILQSCNGLLLCRTTDKGISDYRGAYRYYVFNPTTKQSEFIPFGPKHLKLHRSICFMALAFHQTDCANYKVVCIRQVKRYVDLYQILIYSSDTRKWKISIQSFSGNIYGSHQGVYWNGAVDWAPCYDNGIIFYFKIDGEQLQTLPFPAELKLMSSQVLGTYFGESRGHLHLIGYKTHQRNILPLNVYEMFSDHSGWFVKYQVDLDVLSVAFPNMISKFDYCFRVIDVVRGEEEEDTFLVLRTREKIIAYNVHDKSFKHIFSLDNYLSVDVSHRYTETLYSF